MRYTEQVCISRFLTKATVSIVDEDTFTSFLLDLCCELLGSLKVVTLHDDVVCIRRDALWPDKSLVISQYLSYHSHESSDTDTVAPHPWSKYRSRLIGRLDGEGLRVALSKIKDISDF